MENYIIYNNKKIYYTLIVSNRKTTCIQIKDYSIIVRTNNLTSKKYIEQFLLKNIKKILNVLDRQKPLTYNDSSIVKIFGEDFILKITSEYKDNKIYIENNTINIYVSNIQNKQQEIEQLLCNYYLSILKPYALKSFDNFKNITGLYPNKISFKKMKTRWGSCSSKKNISLNILLAKYNHQVIDYVILHELCHLLEMNHSYKFWHLVEKYMPNYKQIKKLLNNS